MAAMTDYLENALLNHVLLGGAAYTRPASVWLALYPTATPPTDAGGGTELSGGSYSRIQVTFGAAANGVAENSGAVSFTNLPAATITHCAVFDASTAGNMLFHGALGTARTVGAGDSVTFAIGALDISLA